MDGIVEQPKDEIRNLSVAFQRVNLLHIRDNNPFLTSAFFLPLQLFSLYPIGQRSFTMKGDPSSPLVETFSTKNLG